jgi:hypothetical protein
VSPPAAGPEPGPYAPPAAHGLAAVAAAVQDIERVVERRVEVEVRRQRETIQSQEIERLSATRPPAAGEIMTDQVVRSLMQKMRSLAREEQFRLGRVR